MGGGYDDHHTELVLDALSDGSLRLRDLSLYIPIPASAIGSIASFMQLRSLTFRLSDTWTTSVRSVIDQLSILDNLISLDIKLPDPSLMPTSMRRGGVVTGPPSLEELRVTGGMPQITELLGSVVRCGLKSVTIHDTSEETIRQIQYQQIIDQWREHVDTIVSHFSQSLRKLVLLWQSDGSYDGFNAITILEPLLSIPGLKYLDCNNFPHLDLSDNDLENMATAWPEISELHLPFSSGSIQPTISSLRSLAHRCSGLHHLTLTVNTQELRADTSTLQIPGHDLLTLYLGYSIINAPITVTRHLDRLFPSLRSLSAVGGYDDPRSIAACPQRGNGEDLFIC